MHDAPDGNHLTAQAWSFAARPNARVLIVEDDAAQLAEMVDALRGAGFTPLSASDARHAVALVTEDPDVDVVVTDVHMSGMDGLDLIAILKGRLVGDGGAQFVIITGAPTLESAIGSLRAGVVDFLVKPVAYSDLIKAVDVAAARAKRHREEQAAAAAMAATIERLEALLRKLSSNGHASTAADALDASTPPIEILRRLMKARERRAALFDPGLVAEPAWDMLLDLALARLCGERLSVTSVCIGSRAPMTTALRRIDDLVSQGLAARLPDPKDARRRFVELTDEGLERLLRYVSEVDPHPAS